MTDPTGPVQVLAVAFRVGASFEGRIAEELDRLEKNETIRVLDLIFMQRDAETGALVRLDFDGTEDAGRVTMFEGEEAVDAAEGLAGAFRLTPDDIREAADALEPGMAAGFMIFEHLWARDLKRAIADTDGVPFVEGFLTPDAVAALAGA